MFDYSNIKVTKIEVGTREWAIAVTDLTMTFLVLGGFFFFLVLEKYRLWGDIKLQKQ